MKWLFKIYRFIRDIFFPGQHCRFHPSCSEYAEEALRKYGVFKGSWLAIKRLSRCHPWSAGGFDPVP